MAQLQSGKYTVAWFKLAEFVLRKEKERALGIYKLLSHSLPNAALSAQLQGDLLLSFADEKAIEAYKRAVTLYEHSDNIIQAAAVCEHIAMLAPDVEIIIRMFNHYRVLNNKVKINKALNYLASELAKLNFNEIIATINSLKLTNEQSFILYESIICNSESLLDSKESYLLLDKIIGLLDEKLITQFCAKLKAVNIEYYNYLLKQLEKSDKSAGDNSASDN